jgi:hypothetical protein
MMMEIGLGLGLGLGILEVLVEIKMDIMEIKEFHHPLIFLEAEDTRLIGLIAM